MFPKIYHRINNATHNYSIDPSVPENSKNYLVTSASEIKPRRFVSLQSLKELVKKKNILWFVV
jgi:isopentenyldiphosphate isomerase